MNKKLKVILYAILIIIIALLIFSVYYVNDYYHAESSVASYLNGNENVTVEKTSNGYYLDGPGTDNALIFYPGAKVEYTSYIPLLMNISNSGVDCFIVEMPFNIAFFGKDNADNIIDNSSYNYSNWYLSGHSLGGSVSSMYTVDNKDKVDGLILLAAYPTDNISTRTLLIYGSMDNILNKKNYEDSKTYLHGNYSEVIIDGANHAQFAFYGKQDGDNNASITRDEQINKTTDTIIEFITNK